MTTAADATPLVRGAAADLVAQSVAGSRVLVTGASGWFGSTMVALLATAGVAADDPRLLLMASRARTEVRPGLGRVTYSAWTPEAVAEFRPDIVVNCAFLTRDRVASLGVAAYSDEVARLSRAFLDTASLPCVRHVVTVSSGAALTADGSPETDEDANPYGHRKAIEEAELLALAERRGIDVVVLRAWAMSGPFVQRPHAYLFSSLVAQALAVRGHERGEVTVASASPVWRRFAAVDEALAVSLRSATSGHVAGSPALVVDTGGPLLEAGALAQRVVDLLAPGTEIVRPAAEDASENRYYADNDDYEVLCRAHGMEPSGLDEQIVRASALIAAGPRP